MILLDSALQARARSGKPIRLGMVGAGTMGRAIANQIVNAVPGIELSAIANRHLDGARRAYAEAGAVGVRVAESLSEFERAMANRQPVITDSATLLCQVAGIDIVLEVTGSIEFGAQVALEAIANGKNLLLMNAELEATLGPILKVYADRAGVIISGSDGDQPGVEMNLYRFVRGIGMKPLLCGNIKGLHDAHRNPTTQEAFARCWGLSPQMATSFADGTKMSFEQATVANATGLGVARRGMFGYQFSGHVDDLPGLFDIDALNACGGIVDYVVGAKPAPGVFVLATHHDPGQQRFLELYKLGRGPLYCFYTPYHLCHFEVPNSVARVALFGDSVTTPMGGPVVEVVAVAKRELAAGERLDGIGFYMTYGICEDAAVAQRDRLLPMGVAEGCRLTRAVGPDQVLTYDDIALPSGRVADRLRLEQQTYFRTAGGAS